VRALVRGGRRLETAAWQLPAPGKIVSAALVADRETLVLALEDGTVLLVDAGSGRSLGRLDLTASADAPKCVVAAPGGFFVGTARGVVLEFELRAGG
jgi:hypothetical protein